MFYSIHDLKKRYGVSSKSIWRWVQEGRFPKPVKLAARTARWREEDLIAYEDNLR